jgi:hypothetical protein
VELTTNSAGRFELTVPNKPIKVSARCPGYVADQFENGADVTLSEGKRQSILIELARGADAR